MPAPKTLAELAAKLRMTEKEAVSAVFHVVDFMCDMELSDNVINCGAYYNSPLNGDDRMIKSFREIIYAIYEELDGHVPKAAGPFVHINLNDGIRLSDHRHDTQLVYMGGEMP